MDEEKKIEIEGTEKEGEAVVVEKKVKKKAAKKKVAKKKPAKKKAEKKVETEEEKAERKPAKKPVKKIERKSSSEEKKAITFSHAHSKHHSSGKFGFLAILFVIILLIAGAWYQTQQVSQESKDAATGLREDVSNEVGLLKQKLQDLAKQLENQNKEDEPEIKSYTSDRMNISFQYPAELGEVNVEEIQQAIEGEVKVGQTQQKALYLTFSTNPDIWLTVITSGYDDISDNRYGGETENLPDLCEDPLAVTEQGYCDLRSVADQQTVEKVIALGGDKLTGVLKYVPLNIRAGGFNGLTINVALGLPPVSGRNLFVSPSEEESKAALDQFFRNLIKNEGLSLITQENITAFSIILGSLQFNQ